MLTPPVSTSDWLEAHRSRLRHAYEKAGERLRTAAEGRKARHDQKIYNPPIAVDQLVFLRNRVQGRNKIQDSWDSTPYRVFQVPQDGGAVYAVERADGTGDPRRIHRSALKVCPRSVEPTTPKQTKQQRQPRGKDRINDSDSESDTEELVPYP